LSALAQTFVAYLFTDPVKLLGVNGSVVFTLTGSATTFRPAGGRTPAGPIFQPFGPFATAKRSVFGWYAQIGIE
jgi:hypothetical protein